MKKNKLTIIICFIFLLFLNNTCSKKKTELDFIKESLERISENAENKNIENLLLYISENYNDDKERVKDDIRAIIEPYIIKYKGIIVNILEVRPIDIKPLQAFIETDIALSSGIARALRKFTNISNKYIRFHIKLVKEGSIWMIESAEWKHITKTELSAESLDILNNIFN